METQIVIVGSGIAGLSLAIKLSEADALIKIVVVTKAGLSDSNTRYAQGGIAAVINKNLDSFEEHIRDTLQCGKGLCDAEVVEMVVRQAPERIKELKEWGTRFDRTTDNAYDLALEGGHTHPRVLHHKDSTGFEIESVLIAQLKKHKNILALEQHSALDLITESGGSEKVCTGIKVIDWKNKKIKKLFASKIILASGGCGQVYLNTTNPSLATGDGYGMAARAGAHLQNMRFMQFHPTALYLEKPNLISYLISEAVRGFGAYIVDMENKRFLFKYDLRGELAPRDSVSEAIMNHLNTSTEHCVYLDARHLNRKVFNEHFPSIVHELLSSGIDPSKDLIPVMPSAHYQCGGIQVNKVGVSSIKNLYAIGEVSCTGLHGANRLASNSLLEALVYAHNASLHILSELKNTSITFSSKTKVVEFKTSNEKQEFSKSLLDIKKRMSASAFQNNKFLLLKDKDHLENMEQVIENNIQKNIISPELLEFRNVIASAKWILTDKLEAIENKEITYTN